MAGQTIDYEALAKQHGAVSSEKAPIDYNALAKQHGAVASEPAAEYTTSGAQQADLVRHSLPGVFSRVTPEGKIATPKEIKSQIADAIPMVAGTAASLIPGVGQLGLAGRLGVQFLTGAGGEAAKQFVKDKFLGDKTGPQTTGESLADIAGAGATNAAFELPFAIGSKVVRGISKPPVENLQSTLITGGKFPATAPISSRDVAKANNLYELGLTAPEVNPASSARPGRLLQWVADKSPWGKGIAKDAQEQGARNAANWAESSTRKLIGQDPAGPMVTGKTMQNGIADSKAIFSGESAKRYMNVDRISNNAGAVDLLPSKSELDDILKKEFKAVKDQGFEVGKVEDFYKMLDGPNQVSFSGANAIRKHLSGASSDINALNKDAVKGLSKRVAASIDAAMEKAAMDSGRPDVIQAFREANDFHRAGMETFGHPNVVASAEHSLPERAIDVISPKSEHSAIHAKKAILDVPMQYGDPAQKQAAQENWNNFREEWLHRNIIGDPNRSGSNPETLQKMKGNMEKWGPDVLKQMFSDTEGKEVLTNLKTIAEAMSRMQPPKSGATGALGYHAITKLPGIAMAGMASGDHLVQAAVGIAGTLASAVAIPGFMGWVIHNKAYTKMLTEGLGPKMAATNTGANAIAKLTKAYFDSQNGVEEPQNLPTVKGVKRENPLAGTPAADVKVSMQPPAPPAKPAAKKVPNPYEE